MDAEISRRQLLAGCAVLALAPAVAPAARCWLCDTPLSEGSCTAESCAITRGLWMTEAEHDELARKAPCVRLWVDEWRRELALHPDRHPPDELDRFGIPRPVYRRLSRDEARQLAIESMRREFARLDALTAG